jgi:hypothetical protein
VNKSESSNKRYYILKKEREKKHQESKRGGRRGEKHRETQATEKSTKKFLSLAPQQPKYLTSLGAHQLMNKENVMCVYACMYVYTHTIEYYSAITILKSCHFFRKIDSIKWNKSSGRRQISYVLCHVKNLEPKPGTVAHAYNPSYLGG